jgi:ketosteroid isomerase-like protein
VGAPTADQIDELMHLAYAAKDVEAVARVSLADGTELEIHGRGTTIARRGADGEWRLVIDHASAR